MILTSTAKIKSKKCALIPVKTTEDIPFERIPEAMAKINALELVAPVKLGEVVINDFVIDGISLVATKTVTE